MYIPQPSIPLDRQASTLLRTFKSFEVVRYIRSKEIVFEGFLQPTPLSKIYKVRIEYRFRSRPTISLPEEDFSKVRPPHTFKEGDLCLYHRNGTGAWTSKKSISKLVPMITHWLWCYEMWLVTGKWYGEEYPHELTENKEPS